MLLKVKISSPFPTWLMASLMLPLFGQALLMPSPLNRLSIRTSTALYDVNGTDLLMPLLVKPNPTYDSATDTSSEDIAVEPSPWDINPSISNKIASVHAIMANGKNRKVLHQSAKSTRVNGQIIDIDGQPLVNFGSCSYLGLETHDAIVEATIMAARQYGVQFSSSRAYCSNELYDELESLLGKIYEKPVLACPSTSLGHQATLPVLIGEKDAIILDMQVHASVQVAAEILKARGVPLTVIRHNDMSSLEDQIKKLKANYETKNIWYLADGVYSMYGDYAKFDELTSLLDRYPQFHVYIDDAHGASWTGKNGRGVARSHMDHHDRMVLAVSLCKSFGTAGGAIVFANEAQRSLVRYCGGPIIFGGPIQPPMLGAACATAKLHLSDEIKPRQEYLAEIIRHCDESIAALGLPQYSRNMSPIFFIPVGKPDPMMDLVQRVKNDGFYINSAGYPAVPMRRGGLRIVVTHHHSKDDIDNLLASVRKHYGPCLRDHGITAKDISKNFNIDPELLTNLFGVTEEDGGATVAQAGDEGGLNVEIHRSIHDVDKVEWDQFFAGQGNLDSQSLSVFEETFNAASVRKEDQWDWYYFIARNTNNEVVAATFFTSVEVKDDMLSTAKVSEKVEQMRQEQKNPYLFTSKSVMMGSPLSSMVPLRLNRNLKGWKQALTLLIKEMETVQIETNATQILLRGASRDPELANLLLDNGYTQLKFLDQFVISNLSYPTLKDYYSSPRFNSKKRSTLKRLVFNHLDEFRVEFTKPSTTEEIEYCYGLCKKVEERSKELNMFQLPLELFQTMSRTPQHDILRLYKKQNCDDGKVSTLGDDDKPLAVCYSNVQGMNYGFELVGFERVPGINIYLLILYFVIERAHALGCKTVDLGFTSGESKRKLGAEIVEQDLFIQLTEEAFYTQAKLSLLK